MRNVIIAAFVVQLGVFLGALFIDPPVSLLAFVGLVFLGAAVPPKRTPYKPFPHSVRDE